MAIHDMTMFLGGKTLPRPSTFKRLIQPNETDITTLGGTLYTDFINNRRVWVIGWKLLTEEDFNIIYALYQRQYSQALYLDFQFDAYSIYSKVKINITDQEIKYNGNLIANFSITLKEQVPFS